MWRTMILPQPTQTCTHSVWGICFPGKLGLDLLVDPTPRTRQLRCGTTQALVVARPKAIEIRLLAVTEDHYQRLLSVDAAQEHDVTVLKHMAVDCHGHGKAPLPRASVGEGPSITRGCGKWQVMPKPG